MKTLEKKTVVKKATGSPGKKKKKKQEFLSLKKRKLRKSKIYC